MQIDDSNLSVYSQSYSDENLWHKLKKYSLKMSKSLIKKVLVLFYSAIDPDTPTWAKSIIYATLGYFILPIDGIPDIMPFIGFSDDLTAIVSALTIIHVHIKPEHKLMADEKLNNWLN